MPAGSYAVLTDASIFLRIAAELSAAVPAADETLNKSWRVSGGELRVGRGVAGHL